MDVQLATAIVTGCIALIGTLVTVSSGQKKLSNGQEQLRKDIAAQLEKHNAVQDERIKALTEKVERHNHVIERTYKLEGRVQCLSERVTDVVKEQRVQQQATQ